MRSLLRDIRYSTRIFLQNSGFTAVAMLSLALGIGANTAIFSVFNTILLRPLPFENPDQLATIRETNPERGQRRRNPRNQPFSSGENRTRPSS